MEEFGVGFLLGLVVCGVVSGAIWSADNKVESSAAECFAASGGADACEAAGQVTDMSQCMRAGGNVDACRAAAI